MPVCISCLPGRISKQPQATRIGQTADVASYPDLRDFVARLDREHELRRIKAEVDPHLEVSEIVERVVRAGGPALLFENVRGPPCRWR